MLSTMFLTHTKNLNLWHVEKEEKNHSLVISLLGTKNTMNSLEKLRTTNQSPIEVYL
jgi:anti-sigma-K factor RskA